MCDFLTRLATAVSSLDGVVGTTIRHGGARGAPVRHRHHPHMVVTLRTGEVVEYPLRGRPKDKSYGYFCSILHGIRRRIKGLLGERSSAPDVRNSTPKAARIHRKRCRSKKCRPTPTHEPTWTRLSANPFEQLVVLAERMAHA